MKTQKIVNLILALVLVLVFSFISFFIKNKWGFSIAFVFTMLIVPLILHVVKVREWKI